MWPQGNVDRLWPAGACVEQLLACAPQEVLDGLLGYAIWKWVFTPPNVSCCLPCIVACLSEGVVVKLPVFAVVVHDFDSVLGCILFERELGGKCFC
jgi:hypothetical protein